MVVDEIFAVDEAESTYYVLVRGGHVITSAHWPQHLEAISPGARYCGTLGGEEGRLIPGMAHDLLAALGGEGELRVRDRVT